jgi:outer membrane protein TolC
MNALNRVLNHPLDEVIHAEEADFKNPVIALGTDRVYTYLDNPESLRLFRLYLLQVGIAAAPELKRIDETIAAQERSLTAAKRDFWVPDISIKGNVNNDFERSGAGSDYPPLSGTQTPDSSFWTASLEASLPLFTSGRRTASVRRNREEIARLRYSRSSTALLVQERIYNASNLLRASYPSLQLTRDAQEASDKNLELITSSYTRGTKSIIDLLDAQNQSLTASQQTVNAVYDFLIDLTTVQRAISQYVFLIPDSAQDEWFDDLDAFIKKTTTVSPLKQGE